MRDNSVLIVSIAFSPNIGGIETHFDDLVDYLDKHAWIVSVLTYTPITTNAKAKLFEKKGKQISIYRIPWFRGVFYTLLKSPILEFLFLLPGLFFMLPILLLTKARSVSVLHSHGLVAGFVSVFWGKVFRKRVITTTHSIYHFPTNGLYREFAKWIFHHIDQVLSLSQQSKNEIKELGIPEKNISVFTYWVDQQQFAVTAKKTARKQLHLPDSFLVLFVGRLVPEKGVRELLEAASQWKEEITLLIIGNGPQEAEVKRYAQSQQTISYLGPVTNNKLALYFSAADIFIIPSMQEEGFGRVIIEALSCGTPVIGANRGAIPEAIDERVGKLVDITPRNIVQWVNYFFTHQAKLLELAKNTRKFAEEKYSDKNAEIIVKSYLG
jgi:glycosyltransferase involved in cell wall biosynthesis